MKEVADGRDKMAKEMQSRIAECEAREVETMKRLKEVDDERDRMTEEVQSRVAGCETREAEVMKRMNQVLADEDQTLRDRVAIEVSLMVDEADSVKARLKEEEERIVKQQVELEEEKQRILFAKEKLMWMQSEQENTRKELNEVETTMKGYGGSLDICREKLVQREKSCCEIEGALSQREQACTKREGEIKDQVKELKMRSVVLNCEMLCHKNEDVLFGREQVCVK
jgi:chromosome segregation ATPase